MNHDTLKALQEKYRPFAAIRTDFAEADRKDGELNDYYISLKDNIVHKDMPTTAGSDILDGYKSTYTADVAKHLEHAGATIIGKTKMDAFGFGTYGQNTENPPRHPDDADLVPGGSSAGSAVLTKVAPFKHVSIAVSTGGSISCPSAMCGITGYTPTNGHVSRHGLIPYADSFDSIGVMATGIDDIKTVEPIITQGTAKDMTHNAEHHDHDITTIGIPRELDDLAINDDVKQAFDDHVDDLDDYNVKQISLANTYEYGVAAYYTIATSEASTNLARYDGLRYGEQPEPGSKQYAEAISEHRGEQFGDEEQRRVLLGTYIRTIGYEDRLYERAKTARSHIKAEHSDAFDEVDAILTPAMPFAEKTLSEADEEDPAETYAADMLTTPPMLAGLPHVCLPSIPGGLHVITPKHTDRSLLDDADSFL